MTKLDYKKAGLRVGLEVHQQLDSRTKLFCGCRAELFKTEPEFVFERRLRPTQSELGQTDPAALFEFQKGVRIQYESDRDTSCLVEMDEEPPHRMNEAAFETALIVSLMLKARPVDEVHVMRKSVIDGSTTTGFQRTCIVALDGHVSVGEKQLTILHVGLEEDAARKMGAKGNIMKYRIDRLCIPLIEVATAPSIHSPKEAEQAAVAIGRILRATGRVKRGLGTIRQDLNISITKGALVEIKGVQELELVSLVVENEVQRQLKLLSVRDELLNRGLKEEDIMDRFVDVTHVFSGTKCEVVKKATMKGKRVKCVKLPKFKGLLKTELTHGVRLGTEMADRAKFWGRTGGIFHTDELPDYGISEDEIANLGRSMDQEEHDSLVFVADDATNANDALKAVNERAREALRGVPHETRAAKPDGSTRYMRPRPGAARMYPETDVPPVKVSETLLGKLQTCLPELPEKKMQRLMQEQGLNRKLARQVLDSEASQLFEKAVAECDVSPTTVAVVLTETVKSLSREGVEVDKVSDDKFLGLFKLVGQGVVTREAIPDIISWLSHRPGAEVSAAVESLGLRMLTRDELDSIIGDVVKRNKDLLQKQKERAFSILMGLAMKEVRGKAKAKSVKEILKEKIAGSA